MLGGLVDRCNILCGPTALPVLRMKSSNAFEHCYEHASPGIVNQEIRAFSNMRRGVFYFDYFTWLLLFWIVFFVGFDFFNLTE